MFLCFVDNNHKKKKKGWGEMWVRKKQRKKLSVISEMLILQLYLLDP